MPSERDHHGSKERAYEIVVIPQGDTGSTRSFKASVSSIVLVCVGCVVVVAALTVAAIVYTPAGLLLPMPEEQLQQRYGAELFAVQKRLTRISSEVLVLREYNNKLRNALGQKELPSDSTFDLGGVESILAQHQDDTTRTPMTAAPGAVSAPSNAPPVTYRAALSDESEVVTFRAEFPIIAPAAGYISRRFESEKGHYGIDYAGKIGSLVVAAADGYVVFAGYTPDDGNTVIVAHGAGYLTMYKHNQSVLKVSGDFVKRGEPIALLGNSGRTSSGPHLHFEVWSNGKAQNPNDYLIASEL